VLSIHIRVDESFFIQRKLSLRIATLCLGQNPKVIYLFPIEDDLVINFGPSCVGLANALSAS
jgi:hypothetical protein